MSTTSASDPIRSPDGRPNGAERPPAPLALGADPLNAALAQNWWAIALRGVLGILFGIIALVLPGPTMLSLVLIFAAYLLIDGVLAIVAAVRAARHHNKWGWLTFEGIVNIITALVMVAFPAGAVLAFVIVVAVWALLTGGLMIGAAIRLKGDHGRGWLIFGGITSMIYGVLLLVAPLIGALVLTWWLGAYALVFGVALLVLAFKLRARRDDHPQLVSPPRAA
jgi:uncharacterized membrane protein HdeD (DUF308 family)